jgi:hypothetical protein
MITDIMEFKKVSGRFPIKLATIYITGLRIRYLLYVIIHYQHDKIAFAWKNYRQADLGWVILVNSGEPIEK